MLTLSQLRAHVPQTGDRPGGLARPYDQAMRSIVGAPALIAAALLALAGCAAPSGSPGSPGSTPAAVTARSAPSPAEGATAAADVLAAYRAFWDEVTAAASTADQEAADLRRHATGEQLVTTIGQLYDLRRRGLVLRGRVRLDPRVVSLSGDGAVVEDCQDGSRFLAYDARTGAPRGRSVKRRDRVTAYLTYDRGAWKVYRTRTREGGC